MTDKLNPTDLISLVERIVKATEDAGEDDQVTLPVHTMRALLELAKQAPKLRGRQQVSGRAKVYEAVEVYRARRRKAELIESGMPKEKAAEQAAEEATARFADRNLAASTILRKMQGRR